MRRLPFFSADWIKATSVHAPVEIPAFYLAGGQVVIMKQTRTFIGMTHAMVLTTTILPPLCFVKARRDLIHHR